MKRIIKILFLLAGLGIFSPLCLHSQALTNEKLDWISFEKAAELVKTKPKLVFIDVYTDWCGWCKVLDKSTFSDTVISGLLNKYFYTVKLNAERKDTVVFNGYTFVNPNNGPRSAHQLATSLLNNQMSYPTMVFLDAKMQMITLVQSYLKPADLEPILNYIGEEKYLTMTYDSFRVSFVPKIAPVELKK